MCCARVHSQQCAQVSQDCLSTRESHRRRSIGRAGARPTHRRFSSLAGQDAMECDSRDDGGRVIALSTHICIIHHHRHPTVGRGSLARNCKAHYWLFSHKFQCNGASCASRRIACGRRWVFILRSRRKPSTVKLYRKGCSSRDCIDRQGDPHALTRFPCVSTVPHPRAPSAPTHMLLARRGASHDDMR